MNCSGPKAPHKQAGEVGGSHLQSDWTWLCLHLASSATCDLFWIQRLKVLCSPSKASVSNKQNLVQFWPRATWSIKFSDCFKTSVCNLLRVFCSWNLIPLDLVLKLQEMRSNGEYIEAVGSMLLQWVNQLVTSIAKYMCYFQYSKNVEGLIVMKGTEVGSTEMLWDLNPRPSVLYIPVHVYSQMQIPLGTGTASCVYTCRYMYMYVVTTQKFNS